MKYRSVAELKEKDQLSLQGRTLYDAGEGTLYCNWTCSGFTLRFRGTCLIADMTAWAGEEVERDLITYKLKKRLNWPCISVFLDGAEEPCRRFKPDREAGRELIFQSEETEEHEIRIVKLTENLKTEAGWKGFYYDGEFLEPEITQRKRIEFLGDSITCGFGNETDDKDRGYYSEEQNGWKSYAALTGRKLKMDYSLICSSGICLSRRKYWLHQYAIEELYEYCDRCHEDRVSRGREGAVLTKWDFEKHPSDYIVINLGTNDANAIMNAPDEAKEEALYHQQYLDFLKTVRRYNPKAQIICTLGSMDYYLYHHITEIVEEYRQETADRKISCLRLPKMYYLDPAGACSHPHVTTHEKMAQALAQYIEKLELQE